MNADALIYGSGLAELFEYENDVNHMLRQIEHLKKI